MEQEIRQTNSKGGRPKKVLKRNIALTVKCNTTEQTLIISKASQSQLTVSEYLIKRKKQIFVENKQSSKVKEYKIKPMRKNIVNTVLKKHVN